MTDVIGKWRSAETGAPGFRQFYREWQPHEAPGLPVLALHGSLTQSGMWIDFAERAENVRVLCPDQRGFGLSEDPPGDACADFARDAMALADALMPGPFVVMGHSFACSIALELAREKDTRIAGVVLVDPVVRLPGSTPGAPPAPNPASFGSLEDAERHFATTEEGEWTPESLRRFTRDVMIAVPEGAWRFPYSNERLRRLRAFTASPAGDYGLFAKARDIGVPVLVFRGGLSKRFAASAEAPFLQSFEGPVRCIVCPKSGHFPASTEPEIVERGLKEFLAARE